MPIKTFRGQIADGEQDTIVLHTNNGSIGYRIVKFQIMDQDPSTNDVKLVVKIYTVPQASVDSTVNFQDTTLLGTSFLISGGTTDTYGGTTIFDNEIFNQDIYVTAVDKTSSSPVNYYIELEQVKLDLNENTVATLKDMRNTP